MTTLFAWPARRDIPAFLKPIDEHETSIPAGQATPPADPIEDIDSSQEFADCVNSIVIKYPIETRSIEVLAKPVVPV